jgi:hypothetical protein
VLHGGDFVLGTFEFMRGWRAVIYISEIGWDWRRMTRNLLTCAGKRREWVISSAMGRDIVVVLCLVGLVAGWT